MPVTKREEQELVRLAKLGMASLKRRGCDNGHDFILDSTAQLHLRVFMCLRCNARTVSPKTHDGVGWALDPPPGTPEQSIDVLVDQLPEVP